MADSTFSGKPLTSASFPIDAQERAEDRKLFSASDVAHAEQAAREAMLETHVDKAVALDKVTAARLDERKKVLEEAELWCGEQSEGMGAVDGYDYRSGEEYAYRNAALHFGKAYRALKDKP